jgi:excisionase family DNA binding protein
MTVKQVAFRLEVSSATIYALVAAGKLKCHRVGLGRGAIRISEEHVAEFLTAAPKLPVPVPPRVPAVKLKHLRQ